MISILELTVAGDIIVSKVETVNVEKQYSFKIKEKEICLCANTRGKKINKFISPLSGNYYDSIIFSSDNNLTEEDFDTIIEYLYDDDYIPSDSNSDSDFSE